MNQNILFIGMDVHKESIEIAVVDGANQEVRRYGKIGGTRDAMRKALRKLVSQGKVLHFCYEAGPCGYELYRYLVSEGHACWVVAPSLIPKKAGDKVKTDKRDAIQLARLLRAGELTPVYVPNREDEAIRDLSRAREDAMLVQKAARQRLKSFLLRHDIRYQGKTAWNESHLRWLADEVSCSSPAQQIVFQEYVNAVTEADHRLKRLNEQIEIFASQWRLYPVVEALMSMRGVKMTVAVTVVSELGDLSRFENPKQLMSFLGLTPSEYSSGPRQTRGRITKTGNGHVRRILIEAAWCYRFPAKVSREMQKRQETLPLSIRAIAWRAQLRLTQRYRHLQQKGKSHNVTVVALARELVGFMWAIAKEVNYPR
ncbi:MAG: IS110 family transposase [Gammaproteobacteria bacterium]|nr:IS110 family transposase [Gammaproteobacteria bacterium]